MPVSPDVPPDVPVDVARRKAAIRVELLAARRSLDPERLAADAPRVLSALGTLLAGVADTGGGRVVAAYVPVGPEPGGTRLPDALRDLLDPADRLLLPVLRPDLDLDWADYAGTLVPGSRGLREPPGPRCGPEAVVGASLLVVPAVAVDRQGVRLGRGGGSYDRVLARTGAGTPTVALLHDGELWLGDLPADPHDRRVAAAITPRDGLARF